MPPLNPALINASIEKRTKISAQTAIDVKKIKAAVIEKWPQSSHLVEPRHNPSLKRGLTYYPRFQNTQVKVLDCDTLDAAILIQHAHELHKNSDTGPVFVLSFANAIVPKGGWMNGSRD